MIDGPLLGKANEFEATIKDTMPWRDSQKGHTGSVPQFRW
jgi:hypothetical protein